jgi:hypothetical protein
MIPQRFHRIWVGGGMPPQFHDTGQSWLDHHPGWEMTTWTEDDMPPLKNQAIYDDAENLVESRLLGRFRSNLARLELLYRFGGVYVDCDFVARAAIPDRYLTGQTFVARETERFVNNGLIIAQPGCPYLGSIIDAIPDSVRSQPGKPSNVTTGPHLLTRLLTDEVGTIPTAEIYPYHWRQADQENDLGDSWAYHLWAGSREQVSVIIPWRPGCAHRERSMRYVTGRLAIEHPDWQVTLVDSSVEPFSRADAINRGLVRSFGKIIVVHDSDVWVEDLPSAVAQVRSGTSWALPHLHVHRLTDEASQRYMEGARDFVSEDYDERPYIGTRTGGVVVVSRDTITRVPPDSRFRGWGGEDEAWSLALRTLVGEPWRSDQPLIHLWHPPQPRQSRAVGNEHNLALLGQYRAAKGSPEMMRRLVDGKPLQRVATFEHTITGRRWLAKVGTDVYERYRANRYLREIVAGR